MCLMCNVILLFFFLNVLRIAYLYALKAQESFCTWEKHSSDFDVYVTISVKRIDDRVFNTSSEI